MTNIFSQTTEGLGEAIYNTTTNMSDITDITASVGITREQYQRTPILRVRSVTAGDCDISINPQIEAPSGGNPILEIHGTDDTRTVTLEDGNGLTLLQTPLILGADSVVIFRYMEDSWVQLTPIALSGVEAGAYGAGWNGNSNGATKDALYDKFELISTETKTYENKTMSGLSNTFSNIDHGTAVIGLGDDDHTQYALLAGRSGGQSITGGTASGNNLTLNSTSHAIKGDILLQTSGGDVGIGTSSPANYSNYNTLDVMGLANGSGGVLQSSTLDRSVEAAMYTTTALGGIFATFTNSPITLRTNGTTALTVNTNQGLVMEKTLYMREQSTTPSAGTQDVVCNIYMKGDKFIIQFNNGGTTRYKYLDLTGTGVTWVHTTSAP